MRYEQLMFHYTGTMQLQRFNSPRERFFHLAVLPALGEMHWFPIMELRK